MRTKSGGLNGNRDLLIPDPEIGGSRDISDAYLGAVIWTGEYEIYSRGKEIAALLYWALGAKALVTTTGISTHTITPATTLPLVSIEDKVGNGFDVFNYTDAKLNTLHLEAEANGFFMATAGFLAKKQTAGNTASPTPPIDASPMSVGTNITITYNAVALPAKSFTMDINNNLEDDDFRLGSFFVGDTTEKRREVTMGVTIRPADSSLWKTALYGSGATVSPVGLTDKQQIVITIQTFENIPAGTPLTPYTTTITIPKGAIKPFNVSPSGDDVLQHELEIQALQPVVATPILTAVVKNDMPAMP
jgi:hypothetical protein